MSYLQNLQDQPATQAHPDRPAIILDRWQYRITAEPHPWSQPMGPVWLSVGPGLTKAGVLDASGQSRGVLLGFPIDLHHSRMITSVWQAPIAGGPLDDATIFRCLRRLGGRYVWIVPHEDGMRLYPDAATQVPCVWDATTREAGTTAGAILQPSEYKRRFRAKLFDHLNIQAGGWFPAGLTAHEGVERLLPNHYLDLTTWKARRFCAVPTGQPHPQTAIAAVRDCVRAHVFALRQGARQPAIGLDGSDGSKAILACARDQAPRLRFVTRPHDLPTNRLTPKQIARVFGLRHTGLPPQNATPEMQNRFLKRGAHCFAGTELRTHADLVPLADSRVLINSLGCKLAEAVYWTRADPASIVVTPDLLMTRLGLPRSPIVKSAIGRWLDDLPEKVCGRAILDLAYLELRLGPADMAQFSADPTVPRFAAMISYDSLQMLRDMPEDWRIGRKFSAAIIAQHWPALDTFPYAALNNRSEKFAKFAAVLTNPMILFRKSETEKSSQTRNNC